MMRSLLVNKPELATEPELVNEPEPANEPKLVNEPKLALPMSNADIVNEQCRSLKCALFRDCRDSVNFTTCENTMANLYFLDENKPGP